MLPTSPAAPAPQSPWLRPLRRRTSPRLRLVCLPFAGGGTAPFRALAAALPEDIEPLAACLPGREERIREPPLTRVQPVVEGLARAVAPWLDRPFAIYGHSMGGILGYELALALRRTLGVEPAALLVSARSAPDWPGPPPIHQLPDDRFIAALDQRYGAIPAAVRAEPELLALFTPILRADLTLVETYDPGPGPRELLRCPLTALGGTRDRLVTEESLRGWGARTAGPFELRMLEGDHFFIQQEQSRFLPTLLEQLRRI